MRDVTIMRYRAVPADWLVSARTSRLLLGALAGAVMVNVLQLGSVEVAAGTVGRTLRHSASAGHGCTDMPEGVSHPPAAAAWAVYRRAVGEAARSAHSARQRRGSVAELVRSGNEKTIEALGGSLPPQRALQSVAMAIVVRSSGRPVSAGFAPAPDSFELCG